MDAALWYQLREAYNQKEHLDFVLRWPRLTSEDWLEHQRLAERHAKKVIDAPSSRWNPKEREDYVSVVSK